MKPRTNQNSPGVSFFRNLIISLSKPDHPLLDDIAAGAGSAVRTMVRVIALWVALVVLIGQSVGRLEQVAGQIPFVAVGLINLFTVLLLVAVARHRI